MKTVKQLLQGKATGVHTIGPDDPVIEALRRMAAHEIGALPVMAWCTLFGSLALLPMALWFDSLSEFGRLDTRLFGYWLYTGIFPVGGK